MGEKKTFHYLFPGHLFPRPSRPVFMQRLFLEELRFEKKTFFLCNLLKLSLAQRLQDIKAQQVRVKFIIIFLFTIFFHNITKKSFSTHNNAASWINVPSACYHHNVKSLFCIFLLVSVDFSSERFDGSCVE